MRKTYIIDTNILASDPEVIEKLEGNDVILPAVVLEELDNLKSSYRKTLQTRENARKAQANISQYLDAEFKDGFYLLDNGIRLKVDFGNNGNHSASSFFDADTANAYSDNKILSIAMKYNAILITNDVNLQAKAKALKIKVETYDVADVSLDSLLDQDFIELSVEDIETMRKEHYITKEGCKNGHYYLSNAFLLKCIDNFGKLIKVDSNVIYFDSFHGETIKPKNAEQIFFIDALYDAGREVVVNVGSQGSGKTILSLAYGLYAVLDKKMFDEIVIVKPPVQLLNEDRLGYLPGDLFDKMTPYLRGILSALKKIFKQDMEYINRLGSSVGIKEAKSPEDILKVFVKLGLIRIAPIDTIKGETFDDAFIIVDEAQDLTYTEAKALMTRIGERSKTVVIGDLNQISIPYTTFKNSGLSIIANAFDNKSISAIVRMRSVHRSEVAKIAVENI